MPRLHSIEIENYRSFYTRQILELDSKSNKKVTALFGPNSGGKSNTARALAVVQEIVISSANANWILPHEPFLLRQGASSEPTSFTIRFEHSGRQFAYSFSYTSERIVYEELKEKSQNTNKMRVIFRRSKDNSLNASANKHGFNATLMRKTRKETLLITKAFEDNNKYAGFVFDLAYSLIIIPGDMPHFSDIVVDILRDNPRLKEKTIALMRRCDFAIRDIELIDVPITEEMVSFLPLPDSIKREFIAGGATAITTTHIVRDAELTAVGSAKFDFDSQESMGTKKFLETAAPIVDALEQGKTVYIDEFGAFLHPTLSKTIVSLFKSNENQSGAQLILNTHNTALMSQADLAREEIVFVEKNLSEESVITPSYKKSIRKEEAFAKRYLDGLYGAVPLIRERA